jgi:hypothetical protein
MLIGAQPLGAQQVVPPTKAKDQTMKTFASFDLTSEMPELTGRYLRARVRTSNRAVTVRYTATAVLLRSSTSSAER